MAKRMISSFDIDTEEVAELFKDLGHDLDEYAFLQAFEVSQGAEVSDDALFTVELTFMATDQSFAAERIRTTDFFETEE